jgi:hypothetical protein
MTSLPMLERVIEWASVRDVAYPSLASRSSSAAVVQTAVPALAPRGAGGGARSFPSRTDPSGASRPPLSPTEARERWVGWLVISCFKSPGLAPIVDHHYE